MLLTSEVCGHLPEVGLRRESRPISDVTFDECAVIAPTTPLPPSPPLWLSPPCPLQYLAGHAPVDSLTFTILLPRLLLTTDKENEDSSYADVGHPLFPVSIDPEDDCAIDSIPTTPWSLILTDYLQIRLKQLLPLHQWP
jgi:hypothetical protein